MYGQSRDESKMKILKEGMFEVESPELAIAKAYENPGHKFVYENEKGEHVGIVRDRKGLRKEILTDPDRKAKENAGEAERVMEQNYNIQREGNSHSYF